MRDDRLADQACCVEPRGIAAIAGGGERAGDVTAVARLKHAGFRVACVASGELLGPLGRPDGSHTDPAPRRSGARHDPSRLHRADELRARRACAPARGYPTDGATLAHGSLERLVVFAASAGASPTREEISAAMACAARAPCARPPPAPPPKPKKKRPPRRPSAFDKAVESLPLRAPPLRPQQVMTFDDDHHRVVVSVAMARFLRNGNRRAPRRDRVVCGHRRRSVECIRDRRCPGRRENPSKTARIRALGAPQTVG